MKPLVAGGSFYNLATTGQRTLVFRVLAVPQLGALHRPHLRVGSVAKRVEYLFQGHLLARCAVCCLPDNAVRLPEAESPVTEYQSRAHEHTSTLRFAHPFTEFLLNVVLDSHVIVDVFHSGRPAAHFVRCAPTATFAGRNITNKITLRNRRVCRVLSL
jgi:hypothetical protein